MTEAKRQQMELARRQKAILFRVGYAEPPEVESARWISLGKGRFTLVDEALFEELNRHFWSFSCGYAKRYEGGKSILMHRVVCNSPLSRETDHINGDKLDNRRSNLRACKAWQNSLNRPKPRHGLSSRFKGVTFDRRRNKFMAQASFEKKHIFLGYFEDELSAALAYNAYAKRYLPDFAWLNPIYL